MMKFSETLVAWNQVEIAIFTGIAVARMMAIENGASFSG